MKIILPIILCCAFFSACKTSKITISKKLEKLDLQGHRGARGLMPENTIPAMFKAIDLGVKTLEMDVVFTKDNVAILSHEPFFNHEISTAPTGKLITDTEEKSFNIFKMTFAETQKFDVGIKAHPRFASQQKMAVSKPSLSSLIDSVENYTTSKKLPQVFYNIETKTDPATDNSFHPKPAAFIDLLMKVINEKNIAERVIVQSFDRRTLQHLHKKYPLIKTALLVEAFDKSSFRKQIKDLGFTPTIYSPEQTIVTPILVKACHDKGIKIIPWTVNEKKKIKELSDMGVDGIISDYPNLFSE